MLNQTTDELQKLIDRRNSMMESLKTTPMKELEVEIDRRKEQYKARYKELCSQRPTAGFDYGDIAFGKFELMKEMIRCGLKSWLVEEGFIKESKRCGLKSWLVEEGFIEESPFSSEFTVLK